MVRVNNHDFNLDPQSALHNQWATLSFLLSVSEQADTLDMSDVVSVDR